MHLQEALQVEVDDDDVYVIDATDITQAMDICALLCGRFCPRNPGSALFSRRSSFKVNVRANEDTENTAGPLRTDDLADYMQSLIDILGLPQPAPPPASKLVRTHQQIALSHSYLSADPTLPPILFHLRLTSSLRALLSKFVTA